MKTKIVIFSITAVIITFGAYNYWRKKPANITWRTTKLIKGEVNMQVSATGTIEAVTSVVVGSQVSGTICKLFADYNDHVKAGQMIALIDTSFLYASLMDAKAATAKAEVQAKQSKIDFDRTNTLFKNKVVAQTDFEQANTTYQSNICLLNSARAQFNRAKINLDYAKIKSPIDGIVISRNVDIGQTVAASFNTPTLFTVANDLTKMQIMADIDETDIGEVMVGEKVTFKVDAYPDLSFSGEVQQIRLQPIVIQNVVNYAAVISTANPDLKLMPGMTANITINVKSHKNVFRIPATALRFSPAGEFASFIKPPDSNDERKKIQLIQSLKSGPNLDMGSKNISLNEGDSTYVWIKKGEMIDAVKVKIGISDGTNTEVSGSLRSGDEVIISGSQNKGNDENKQNPFMPKMPPARKS